MRVSGDRSAAGAITGHRSSRCCCHASCRGCRCRLRLELCVHPLNMCLSLLRESRQPKSPDASWQCFALGSGSRQRITRQSTCGVPASQICRHIDHSVGLVAAAEDISKARSAQEATSSSASSQDTGGQSQAAGPPPVVFDLHPGRPYRRGLQLPHIVPFNLVSRDPS
jgi:hypothetical protein